MKIMSMSDIHGDFETFDRALEIVKSSGADVLTISGDLNGNHFSEEEGKQFCEAYQILRSIIPQLQMHVQKSNGQRINCGDAAKLIYSGQFKIDDGVKEKIGNYLQLEEKARIRILQNYTGFKQRFSGLEQRVFIIPGSLDTTFMDDVLASYNLHERYPEEVQGMKFIGYGESRELADEIPEGFVIGFNQDKAFEYLSQNKDANIILTHTPPRGFEGDSRLPGDYAFLAYIYRNEPDLVLCGHSHSPLIAIEPKTKTVVANPGNLGRYHNRNFGTFLEIDVDEGAVKPATIYNLNGENINLRKKTPQ